MPATFSYRPKSRFIPFSRQLHALPGDRPQSLRAEPELSCIPSAKALFWRDWWLNCDTTHTFFVNRLTLAVLLATRAAAPLRAVLSAQYVRLLASLRRAGPKTNRVERCRVFSSWNATYSGVCRVSMPHRCRLIFSIVCHPAQRRCDHVQQV